MRVLFLLLSVVLWLTAPRCLACGYALDVCPFCRSLNCSCLSGCCEGSEAHLA